LDPRETSSREERKLQALLKSLGPSAQESPSSASTPVSNSQAQVNSKKPVVLLPSGRKRLASKLNDGGGKNDGYSRKKFRKGSSDESQGSDNDSDDSDVEDAGNDNPGSSLKKLSSQKHRHKKKSKLLN
jgi:hypothetical protein